ncbi:hypothetical protein ABZ826_38820 [Streptomyces sp. NPDC047515]|uniref:hypothetical protein n=1 Tax=Streptomyces sp. NPDC047515 TaxID=3155380 RepID=UPI0033FB693A
MPALVAVAEQLTPKGFADGRIDDPRWLDAARDASVELPRRLLAAPRAFRHDAGPDGVLLLRNLPVVADEPLLPTPAVRGSVERVPTVAASVVTTAMLHLGEVIAFRNEKTGALVQNVVPVPGSEASQSNAGSVLLELHNENAFHDNRPDFVALLCVWEDPAGNTKLCTSSIRRALPLLSAQARAVLREPRFPTEPPPSLDTLGSVTPAHAVLNGDPKDPNVLVDFPAPGQPGRWSRRRSQVQPRTGAPSGQPDAGVGHSMASARRPARYSARIRRYRVRSRNGFSSTTPSNSDNNP